MQNEDLPVVVFSSESLEEIKQVAALFEGHDLVCSVDREAGANYVELTEYDAVEDAPCWAVSVLESQADFATELMESKGLHSMANIELLATPMKPWQLKLTRVAILGSLVSVALLIVGIVLDVLGVIDLVRLF